MIAPTDKQQQAYAFLKDDTTKYILYGGASGGGKSWLGCEWLMLSAYHLPGSRWFIGRNNIKDTRESVLITWRKVCKANNFDKWRSNVEGIKLDNGSEILFLDLTFYPQKDQHFERLGSKEFTGGWVEEAGEIEETAFDVLKSRVGRHMNQEHGVIGKILITCNPKKGWLYRIFYQPWREGSIEPYMAFVEALPEDNPHLTEDYLMGLESISDQTTKERLLHGNWDYADDPNSLIEQAAIDDLYTNTHVPEGRGWIVADIAAEGSDRFVIGYWKGLRLVEIVVHEKSDGPKVMDAITKMKMDRQVRNANIVIDTDGVGALVPGFFRGCKQFKNGARPENGDNYENLKTQCYYELTRKVNKGEIYIAPTHYKEQINEELQEVKSRDSDKDGKLKIQRKEEIKKRIGRSPDFSDMLMMRMWPLVKPKKRTGYKAKTI